MYEVDEAATRIREEVDKDANIIVGATFDESLDGIIRVSVVATGIDKIADARPQPAPAAEPRAPMRSPEKRRTCHDAAAARAFRRMPQVRSSRLRRRRGCCRASAVGH